MKLVNVLIFNPVTALFGAIAALEIAFKLLGWEE